MEDEQVRKGLMGRSHKIASNYTTVRACMPLISVLHVFVKLRTRKALSIRHTYTHTHTHTHLRRTSTRTATNTSSNTSNVWMKRARAGAACSVLLAACQIKQTNVDSHCSGRVPEQWLALRGCQRAPSVAGTETRLDGSGQRLHSSF
jgi:hypothetical protein